jgi:TonB family protein
MIGPARISRLLSALWFAALVSAILLPRAYAADDLEQSLRSRYGNKTLVLRGFYHADKLNYDSAGMLAGNLRVGDWTVDGVVHVTSINVSDRRLTIHADRLTLIYDGHALAFQTSGNKKPKRTSRLRIETELDAGAVTAEKGQALLAKIFLTPPDRLADIVPDYWKSCVLAASANLGKDRYTACRFGQELAAVPGVSQSGQDQDKELATKIAGAPLVRIGKGVTPPRVRSAPSPEFSTEARELHYQGTITLWLVVDTDGKPRNISIAKPLGMGLDGKAVECVEKWRFDPAQRDGQPVAVEMVVQVDFHLY